MKNCQSVTRSQIFKGDLGAARLIQRYNLCKNIQTLLYGALWAFEIATLQLSCTTFPQSCQDFQIAWTGTKNAQFSRKWFYFVMIRLVIHNFVFSFWNTPTFFQEGDTIGWHKVLSFAEPLALNRVSKPYISFKTKFSR